MMSVENPVPTHAPGTEKAKTVPEPTEAPVLQQAEAMRQLGIDESLYQAILKEYFDENGHTGEELARLIQTGDYAGAALTVHKIKSSSGSIGAKALAECAIALQKLLTAGDVEAIRMEHERFQALLARTLMECKSAQET